MELHFHANGSKLNLGYHHLGLSLASHINLRPPTHLLYNSLVIWIHRISKVWPMFKLVLWWLQTEFGRSSQRLESGQLQESGTAHSAIFYMNTLASIWIHGISKIWPIVKLAYWWLKAWILTGPAPQKSFCLYLYACTKIQYIRYNDSWKIPLRVCSVHFFLFTEVKRLVYPTEWEFQSSMNSPSWHWQTARGLLEEIIISKCGGKVRCHKEWVKLYTFWSWNPHLQLLK